MKILTNVANLSPIGGIELNVFQIGREMVRRGNELSVLYQNDGELAQEYRSFCRDLEKVPKFEFDQFSHPLRSSRSLIPAVSAGERIEPDVVWAQRLRSGPWATGVTRRTAAPAVCHIHGFVGPHTSLNRILGRRVRRFIAVSSFTGDMLSRAGIDARRIDVVLNGIDPSDYPLSDSASRSEAHAQLGIADEAFVVLYCGRLVPEKGVQILVDAWRRLELSPATGRLILAGTGTGQYVDDLLRSLSPSTLVLGAVEDVVTPMHAADVTVVPSIFDEPFGRVVVEAMATGCPVLATRSGGIPEILSGQFERFLVDRDALEDQLADKLRSLYDWRTAEEDLGRQCRAHVERLFTLEKTVDEIQTILSGVAGRD